MHAYAAADETIRVPKMDFGPPRVARARPLPDRFATDRVRRWPHLVIAVLAIAALATPVKLPEYAARSAQAQEVLQLLGR